MPKIAVKLNIKNYTVCDKSHNKDNKWWFSHREERDYL